MSSKRQASATITPSATPTVVSVAGPEMDRLTTATPEPLAWTASVPTKKNPSGPTGLSRWLTTTVWPLAVTCVLVARLAPGTYDMETLYVPGCGSVTARAHAQTPLPHEA